MLLSIGSDVVVLYSNWENCFGGVSCLDFKCVGGVWIVQGDFSMVDFVGVNGIWNNCNGSVICWGIVFISEEYFIEDDVGWVKVEFVMIKYFGKKVNCYDYGYIIEIIFRVGGQSVVKYYVMGCNSYEMVFVFFDNKIVYFGDDGNMCGMYKFVVDKVEDFSVGILYVVKLVQVDDSVSVIGKSWNVSWIKLGYGVDSEIGQVICCFD